MVSGDRAGRPLFSIATAALFTVTAPLAAGLYGVHGPDTELTWTARLAPEGEPGEPLIVSGVVYAADGVTPLRGVRLYAYNTDAAGLYAPPGSPEDTHRISGWLETDREGRYRIVTIRPASYPDSDVTPHVHFVAYVDGRHADTMTLNLVTKSVSPSAADEATVRGAARAMERFATTQPLVRGADGTWTCVFDMKIRR